MHRLLQQGKVRSQVINVPKGLPEILSDITREVLRCQPTTECLCQFIIDYLHSVIVTRDKARVAKSIIDQALHIVDDVIADMCVCDISPDKAAYMCNAMEECFQRFLAQRRCEKDRKKEIVKYEQFDMLDELIKKCKFTDAEIKTTRPIIEAAYKKFVNAYMTAKDVEHGTDDLYQYFREREMNRIAEEAKREAAIKIQSIYRGYLARKTLFTNKPNEPDVVVFGKQELKEREMAARKIQKIFRRHLEKVQSIPESENQVIEDCDPSSDISVASHKDKLLQTGDDKDEQN